MRPCANQSRTAATTRHRPVAAHISGSGTHMAHSLAAQGVTDWRPGRVYFLTLLEPSRDDRTLALTARSASRMPR